MKERLLPIVQKYLKDSAHDYAHTLRVYKNCQTIAGDYASVNMELLNAASLLHDIAKVKEDEDSTGSTDHAILGAQIAKEILLGMQFDSTFAQNVADIISTHRYRANNPPASLEAQILFDADKLDVLGAIGIARSFAIAGRYNQALYSEISINDYIKNNLVGGTANGRIKDISQHTPKIEFELKLTHIPDRMFTDKGKELAKERLSYMTDFFQRLDSEVQND